MSDFGEHLAELAGSGYDVSAPVPYRPFIKLRTRMGPPIFAEQKQQPIDTTPAEREAMAEQIIKTLES